MFIQLNTQFFPLFIRQFKFGTSKSNNSSYLLSEELSSASSNLIIFKSDSETHASVKDIDLFDASSKNWLNKNVNSSIERLDRCQQNLASRGMSLHFFSANK